MNSKLIDLISAPQPDPPRGATWARRWYARRPIATHFTVLMLAFVLLVWASWPIVFSFDLWVMKDRGNLLNVDYLLDRNLRLGVDTFYSYGLLPILLQRLAFGIFGRGYWAMQPFNAIYLVLMALFWARLTAHSARPRLWLASAIVLTPILLWVNPNFPYVLVQLSLLYSLLLILEGRPDLALAVAIIGCYSVPSLPLVAAVLIAGLIVSQWWCSADRRALRLIQLLLPGAVTLVLLGAVLARRFGLESVIVTLSPRNGAEFYRILGYGLFKRGSGLDFLYPSGAGLRYYLANHVTWWIISSLLLFALAARSLWGAWQRGSWSNADAVVVISAAIQAAFAFHAYSVPPQHIIYDPLLAAATLVGLDALPARRLRVACMATLTGLALLGNWAQMHGTYAAWRQTRRATNTAGLYADTEWMKEWNQILQLSTAERVLLLSYGTGVHHYFPTLQSPRVWTLQLGQLSARDLADLQAQISSVDAVVEDLSGPVFAIERVPQIFEPLRQFCVTRVTTNFRYLWSRTSGRCAGAAMVSPASGLTIRSSRP